MSALSFSEPLIALRTKLALLVLNADLGAPPHIIYLGPELAHADTHGLVTLSSTQRALGAPDVNIPLTLLNEIGLGVNSAPGIEAHRAGQDWATRFVVEQVHASSNDAVKITCVDKTHHLEVVHTLKSEWETGCFSCASHLLNRGKAPLMLDWLTSLVLPIPPDLDNFIGFSGRWSQEFSTEVFNLKSGSYVRENRTGRTSHESPPFLIAKGRYTSEYSGACLGMHLAWSGNHKLRVDRHISGNSYAQMGELFFPGETVLDPGQSYTTPTLYFGYSPKGLNALSQSFHTLLSDKILDIRTRDKPRPVHYNTWEALYFDHSEQKLKILADQAAKIGAERFVLDDGWFGKRRNDKAGLGDWWVSEDVYPDGLKPLADYVKHLGMTFGLWFEPEMVNPDSELYRNHPDWVLGVSGVETVPFRNQLILDLTRPGVSEYLFEKIDTIIRDLGVGYIKWDMNRDNTHPGGQDGRAVASAQIRAVYNLIEQLRETHTDLEIESCASGGGRADYEILKHTDRIWVSDNNDALERQRIQRGASYFFPLKVMGSHVGAKTCHITGRVYDMRMRVASAIFGHMGIEADLGLETDADLDVLQAGVAVYKTHRALLHGGDIFRLETSSDYNAVGVVSKNKSEGLFSCVKLGSHKVILPPRLKFIGLDRARRYCVKLVWPKTSPSLTQPSIIDAADLYGKGICVSGEALMHFGMQLPLTFLNVGLIFHIKATD